jgi:hypothetical protein
MADIGRSFIGADVAITDRASWLKTQGNSVRPLRPLFDVTICDIKSKNSCLVLRQVQTIDTHSLLELVRTRRVTCRRMFPIGAIGALRLPPHRSETPRGRRAQAAPDLCPWCSVRSILDEHQNQEPIAHTLAEVRRCPILDYPSSQFFRSRRVANRALIIRIRFSRFVCNTTRSRPVLDSPNVTNRSSSSE